MKIGERFNPYKLFVGSFIPNWLLKRKEISFCAKLTYARLCQYAGEDGEAFPRIETLAAEIGTSVRTVARALAELKTAGLIEVERRGLGQSNSYFFLIHLWNHLATTDLPTLADRQIHHATCGTPDLPSAAVQEMPQVADIRDSSEEIHLKKREDRRPNTPPQPSAGFVELKDSAPEIVPNTCMAWFNRYSHTFRGGARHGVGSTNQEMGRQNLSERHGQV
jgi:DNA-binding transcriptional ArsR family regulator